MAQCYLLDGVLTAVVMAQKVLSYACRLRSTCCFKAFQACWRITERRRLHRMLLMMLRSLLPRSLLLRCPSKRPLHRASTSLSSAD